MGAIQSSIQGHCVVIEQVETFRKVRQPVEDGWKIVNQILKLGQMGENECRIINEYLNELGRINGIDQTPITINYKKIVDQETYMKAIRYPGSTLDQNNAVILPRGCFVA